MKRDISNITRDLEQRKNNDIIRKKELLKKMFQEDPDILEILGQKPKMPKNKFADPDNPTEEELKKREEIEIYNELITHEQIVPFLKLINLQKEVLNFIMFEIEDREVSYNPAVKEQYVTVMCLVHEDDVDTEYGICRQDLLSYLVKDLLSWTNALGKQLQCVNDFGDITDFKYYCRTIKFKISEPNSQGYMGRNNSYDRFKI